MRERVIIGVLIGAVILWYMPSGLIVFADIVSGIIAGSIPVGPSAAIETFVYWWIVLQIAFAPVPLLVAQPIWRRYFAG